MTLAYIVTHAEATHHVDDIVGGWHDSELTERGRRQATAITNTLRDRIDAQPTIFASDLKRTTQPAEIIAAAFNTPIQFDADLREASCGIAEGRPKRWLEERIELPPRTGNRLDHRICDGAESRRETGTRVYRFVNKLLEDPPEVSIIVTHGFAMSYVVFAWLALPLEGLSYARMPADSGGITTVDWGDWGDRNVLRLNETAHLVGI